ncbi:alpha beta-hydrolase [Pterulicium gracile]|uniref:Alpha beta-hydrolase n=1 Tax=Pterulicium gracile TaxID=1884261 RepID=A0A5C3QJU4_9AGAR|nr:alpha beta-hydrolase [Pterula gracilis]
MVNYLIYAIWGLHRSACDLADELGDAGWDYGSPLAHIKRLVARWKDGYDWRVHEARINNDLPQFTRDIEIAGFGALNIHYVHQKSSRKSAIPLLYSHGCRWGFILPLLTNPTAPDQVAFHVVAISLPEFGFSDAPKKLGFKAARYAEVAHKIMLSLRYDEYITEGGDWGYLITRIMAQTHGPKHSKAWHTNHPRGARPSLTGSPLLYLANLFTPLTEAEHKGAERTKKINNFGLGYFYEQSTRPQTLEYSLSDAPVGLLAWIYEKLIHWTNEYPWEDDESPAASLGIYYETVKYHEHEVHSFDAPTIPHGVSFFPKELLREPMTWIGNANNLVFTSEHERGGHFASCERPDAIVNDLGSMFGKEGPAYGVVKGLNGL